MFRSRRLRGLLVACAVACQEVVLAEPVLTAPTIEVVATTPVPGLDQPRDEIPTPVYSLDSRRLHDGRASSLPALFSEQLPGVTVNEIQGNPFQADVNFRGYTASPLLGTPQGLSVYQDGVRINEPFGDIVNWDLVPRVAVRGIDLIPGSNPLFGLNTLGGALAIRTANGFDDPEKAIEVGAGSFGRRSADFALGQRQGEFAVFAAGSFFREDGWRDFSPSAVDQAFAKLSRRSQDAEIDLSLGHADTDLIGNGLLPESMLGRRRAQIFTKPDNTRNRMTLLSLNAAVWLNEANRLSAVAYLRRNLTRTLNGDANDDFADGPHDLAAGGDGLSLETAANNRTRTLQRSHGAALQWAHFAGTAQTAVGATIDRSRSQFEQSAELGIFDAARGVIDGSGEEIENRLHGRSEHWSLFATHTFRPLEGLAATLSGRYNRSRVRAVDQLNPIPPNLDGDFVYHKLNPAAGLSYALSPALTVYANAAQGNRAPTPIELGCADPNNPCSLPNAMQADPFLKQVVSRGIDAGIRGRVGETKWNAGVFAANNYDDILFVGTTTSAGFFTNFGKTRRAGVELGASGRNGALSWRADYAYLKATYRASACLLAENNSTRGQSPACTDVAAGTGDDLIHVSSGQRLPGIPAHSLKLGLDWQAAERWTFAADVQVFSSQYVRGNDNNAHQAGSFTDRLGATRTFLGGGKIPGYSIVNLSLRGQLGGGWEASARVANLFDKRYASAGALAENPFDAAGAFQPDSAAWSRETFLAPGAPRAFWLGLRYAFAGAAR